MLYSTMMDQPLTIPSILERARLLFSTNEIVSILPAGLDPETKAPLPGTHRTTYGQMYPRVMGLANALVAAGVGSGDRVATMALNHYRHLEAYFAVPSAGAVVHTVNIRLHPDQIVYILNDAADKVLLIDNLFVPMLAAILPRVPSLETVVVMGPVPGSLPAGAMDYEAFIAGQPATFAYPEIDERQASGLCYTSGTTGHPKGVLYSHRAIVLHSLAGMSSDCLGISGRDTVMPIVPMFHVNAWGLPYTCTFVGAKQVYTSMFVDPRTLASTIEAERVTISSAVPTIWLGLLEELDRAAAAGRPYDTSSLRTMTVGGSAPPRSMVAGFLERHGIPVTVGWGMTETTPVGTLNVLRPEDDALEPEARLDRMLLSGRPLPLVELEVVDGDGDPVAHDGKTMGRLLVRGPWVTAGYYNEPGASAASQVNGWFDTGDMATIDATGYMLIQDRAKDLIKSGGEWISSVDLENTLMGHPAVKEAAVIALPHPKWDERPFGVIVLRDGMSASKDELNAYLAPHFAKFQLPDDYAFVDEIPRTTVGKWLKRALRERFQSHVLS